MITNDDKNIWNAINWKGEYDPNESESTPPNNEFKEFYESTFNAQDFKRSVKSIRRRDSDVVTLIMLSPEEDFVVW